MPRSRWIFILIKVFTFVINGYILFSKVGNKANHAKGNKMSTYTKEEIINLQASNAAILARMVMDGKGPDVCGPIIKNILALDYEINSVMFNGREMSELVTINFS